MTCTVAVSLAVSELHLLRKHPTLRGPACNTFLVGFGQSLLCAALLSLCDSLVQILHEEKPESVNVMSPPSAHPLT